MNSVLAISSLLIILLAVYAPRISLAGHREYSQQMRNAISTLKKLSPQSRGGRSDTADQCATDCAKDEWQQGTSQINGVNMDPLPGLMNGEQVGKVCGVYDKAKTCLGKCPASATKIGVELGLGLPKYMCVDSSYKQHAQCIYEAVQSVKSTCAEDSKCGEYKKVVEGPPPGDQATLKEFMKNLCQYMICQRDCVKPAVVEKCTSAAYTAMEGIPVKGAEMLKALCQAHGMPQLYPQECVALSPVR